MSAAKLDEVVGTVTDRVIELDVSKAHMLSVIDSLPAEAVQIKAALQNILFAFPSSELEALKVLLAAYKEADVIAQLP